MGVLDLMGHVQQQGQAGRERGQQTRLGQLAGMAYGAPQEQRGGILAQMAQINPQAAQTQQTQFRTGDSDRVAQLSQKAKLFVGMAKAGNQQAVAGMYPELAKEARELFGTDIPDSYDPSFLSGIEQFANIGGGGSGGRVQSRFTNDRGEVIALMADGSMMRTGENAAPNIKILEQPGQVPTGYVTSGGRAGSQVSLGGPQAPPPQSPQPGTYQTPSGMVRVGDLTPEQWEAAQADMQSGGTAQNVNLPQRNVAPPQSGGPVRTPTAAENAGSAEAAKIKAQLGYGPQVAQQEAQAAAMKAEAEARVKAGAERGALDATRSRDAGGAIELLNEAEGLLGKATGSGGGALWDSAIGFFGASNEGADATSALKTIAGQLTSKMPRMQGPQSDKDVQLYKEMAGDLANDKLPVSRRRSALQTIRRLNQEYAPGGSKFSNGSPVFGGGAPAGRQIVRTGTLNGRKVVQFSDGTTSYAD